MDNTVGSLTQEQKSLIIGSILGDGYLRIIRGRKNAFLEINHSFLEKDYVDWKYKKLRNLVKGAPKERKGKGNRIAYRFFTRQHPELTELYRKFYQEGIKVVPRLELNPIILAVWFMDDGCKSRKTYYLNTQRFDSQSQKMMIKILKEQIQVESSLNKDKQYYRIRIKQNSTKRFNDLIYRIVIPSMKYKLG